MRDKERGARPWAGVKMREHEGVGGGERGRVRYQSNVQERVREFEGVEEMREAE